MPARWSQVEWESAGLARLSRRCAWLAGRLRAERVTVWGFDPATDTVSPVTSSAAGEHLDRLLAERDSSPVEDLPDFRRVLAGRSRSITVTSASPVGSATYVRLVTGTPVGVLVIEPATDTVPGRSTLDSMSGTLLGLMAARTARRRRGDNDFVMGLIADCCDQPDVGEALSMVCERLAQRLGARRASIFLAEGGVLRPRMSRRADGTNDVTAWKRFRSAPEPLAMAERAAASGTAVRMDAPDPGLASAWWQETFEVSRAFAVPISSDQATRGALLVGASSGQRFNQRDVAVAAMVGKHLTTVLRVLETQERREADLRAARAVRRLLREGAAAASVHESSAILAKVAAQALGADVAAVYVADEAGDIRDVITLGAPVGRDRLLRRRMCGFPAKETSVWPKVRGVNGPVVADDVAGFRLRKGGVAETLGMRAFVAIPLLSAEGPLGAVTCGMTRGPRHWTARHRDLATQLMLEGSLLVDLARLRERERVHIANLSEQASHDALTGLANRAAFYEGLRNSVDAGRGQGRKSALLLVDLNDFKQVNDTFGHLQGDRLLVAVSERMTAALRSSDLLARIGGDEFAVLAARPETGGGGKAPTGDGLAGVTALAERIHAALAEPVSVAGVPIQLHASLGIALHPEHGDDAENVLQHADMALYHAKRDQLASVVYHGDDYEPETRRLLLLGRLPAAIGDRELTLHYQPIYDLGRGVPVAVEALVRWQHPEYGLLSPAEFVPFAETTGLIHQLTDWVVHTVVAQQRAWARAGLHVRACLNISARDLRDDRLVRTVSTALRRSRGAARHITLEITETAALSYSEDCSDALDRLRLLGLRVSIDDFGAGNTSLAHLARLPLDEIKVDASLIRQLSDSPRAQRVLESIVDLSHGLGLQVTAEGIETVAAAEMAESAGCDFAQGYHFARPQPAENVTELLEAAAFPASRAAPARVLDTDAEAV